MTRRSTIPAAAILLAACASSTEPTGSGGGGGGGGDGPTLSVVARAPRPTRLMLRNGALFWADTSATPIKKFALDNGVQTPLVAALPIPESVTPDAENVYWIAAGTLYQTSPDGAGTSVLDRGSRDAVSQATASIIYDDDNVYWVNTVADGPCSPACSSTIRRVPKSGAAATTLATTMGIIRSIAVRNGFVYWESELDGPTTADGSVGSKIEKVSLTDGSIVMLVDGRLNGLIPAPSEGFSPVSWLPSGGIAVDDSWIYFEDGSEARSARLMKESIDGGAPMILISDEVRDPAAFARELLIDDARVYWIDASSLNSISKDGGAVTRLASDRVSPASLARSGSKLYWLETACCAHRQQGTIQQISTTGGSPIRIAANLDSPVSVAADLSKLYWVEGGAIGATERFGAIARAGLDGSSVDTLIESVESGPYDADASSVYVANAFTIKKVSINGGPARRLAIGDFNIKDLATDGAFVYWVEDAFATIRKVPVDGGPIVTLASGSGPASIIRLSTDYVYWIDHFDAIKRVSKNGGSVQSLIGPVAGGLTDFVLDGDNVYLSEWDAGLIRRMPLAGGAITTLVSPSPDQNRRLAVDASTLYWIDQLEVGKVSISGANTQIVASGALGADAFVPPSIVVDATSIYWTEAATSLIRKAMPK